MIMYMSITQLIADEPLPRNLRAGGYRHKAGNCGKAKPLSQKTTTLKRCARSCDDSWKCFAFVYVPDLPGTNCELFSAVGDCEEDDVSHTYTKISK